MNFHVDPDRLRTHGGALEDAGAGSAGDLSVLHGQTTGGTASWGTDDAGARLAALYQELTSLTGEALDLLTGGMRDTGSAVWRMGDAFEGMDDASSRDIGRIQGPTWP
jgi:hypothetical protein